MKIKIEPENALEWLALRLNLAPVPILDTQIAFTAARAIMAGTTLGLFDAIDGGHTSAEAIATACRTDPRATRTLLDCLVGVGYLTASGGRYRNGRAVEKWLLARSPQSLRDKITFQDIEWRLLGQLEDYVRSGSSLDLHRSLEPREWEAYQDAMRALAVGVAPVCARLLPLPRSAERMLDIGGSHGLYSVALCRRHPKLRAEILELPSAVPRASAILAKEKIGDRVRHRAGDALVDDLGDRELDLVLINNLVHHFTVEQNRELARRAFRALRPGGIFAIGDLEKESAPGDRGVLGGTLDLYFALTSTSGIWAASEMQGWQEDAGFVVRKPIRDPRIVGYALIVGRRPKE